MAQPHGPGGAGRARGARDAAAGRRVRLLAGAAGGVVVAVALLTALVWPGFALPAEPAPAATVTAPPPSPTVSPAAREGEQTELTDALPDTVLQYAQRGFAESTTWGAQDDVVEAWEITYADGAGAGAVEITVQVGQWADEPAAEGFAAAWLEDAGEPAEEGEVTVGDEVTGAYAVVPGADGAATVMWRNGTVVITATGPADAVEDLYSAYPL
ncbi:hypothetical protein [Puerhibacterium sp. TATVAM-FAB25]|uniref:hypothetical protein n=1 Tax=Puerhibacterium sp. TATVAM-FAB25 TaxID=3093699 RepID=UPI00397B6C9F